MQSIWDRCGFFQEDLLNVTLPGEEGQPQFTAMMDALRLEPPTAFGGILVAFTDDYDAGTGLALGTAEQYGVQLGRAKVLHYPLC